MKRNSEIKWRIQYSEKGVDKREEGTLSFLEEIHMTKRFDNAIIKLAKRRGHCDRNTS